MTANLGNLASMNGRTGASFIDDLPTQKDASQALPDLSAGG